MTDSPSSPGLASWLLLAAAVLAIAGAAVVIPVYGLGNFLPALVVGFVGSLAAFVLALSWERDQDLRRLRRGAEELEERRATEVRRRLSSVHAELERNAESLSNLTIDPKSIEVPEFDYLHPQLLDGAWTANAPRLSELVPDYELVADLTFTYGRLEELRWRLRYRSELSTKALDAMTAPLVDELRREVSDRIERVDKQIKEPTVQPVGLLHSVGLTAVVSSTASIETKVIRGGDRSRVVGPPT